MSMEMAAWDRLPPPLREATNYCLFPIPMLAALTEAAIRRGRWTPTIAAKTISEIKTEDEAVALFHRLQMMAMDRVRWRPRPL